MTAFLEIGEMSRDDIGSEDLQDYLFLVPGKPFSPFWFLANFLFPQGRWDMLGKLCRGDLDLFVPREP